MCRLLRPCSAAAACQISLRHGRVQPSLKNTRWPRAVRGRVTGAQVDIRQNPSIGAAGHAALTGLCKLRKAIHFKTDEAVPDAGGTFSAGSDGAAVGGASQPDYMRCPHATPPTEHARTHARLSKRSLVTAHRITQRAPTPHQFSARRRAELRRVAQLLRRGQRRRWRWRGGLPVGTAAAPTVRACAAVRVRSALSRRSLRCCQGIDRPRSHEVPVVHRTAAAAGPTAPPPPRHCAALLGPKDRRLHRRKPKRAGLVRSTRRAWCRCALEHLMTLLRPQGGMHQPRTPSLRRVPPTHLRAAAAPTPQPALSWPHASSSSTLALPPSVSSPL